MSEKQYEGIAVIGMAGRFPGAESVEEFWANLVAGRESEPEGEWFRFVRIAIYSRDLRPLREHRRSGGPFEAPRLCNYMLVISDRGSR